MKIGPKFKIARRLGAPIFEKTQSQKYALSLSRKEKSMGGRPRSKSEFGAQLIEKQKARLSYGLSERQFANYVAKALKAKVPAEKLFSLLETRLDNTLYRAGFAKTRLGARQMAGHGHVTVNGRRVTIPSIEVRKGDKIGIRAGSAASPLFATLDERLKEISVPAWLTVDGGTKEITVVGEPVYAPAESLSDLSVVVEFYQR